jgi:hypothetical protein
MAEPGRKPQACVPMDRDNKRIDIGIPAARRRLAAVALWVAWS